MLIMGIDPGSRFTGWGLLEQNGNRSEYVASGVIKLPPAKPLEERLVMLGEQLENILDENPVDECALEQIFTAKNARSALVLGHARGVLMLGISRRGIPLFEYTPTQVKQTVVGSGRADKSQVGRMVGVLLSHRVSFQEDEGDALAVALTHGASLRLKVAR